MKLKSFYLFSFSEFEIDSNIKKSVCYHVLHKTWQNVSWDSCHAPKDFWKVILVKVEGLPMVWIGQGGQRIGVCDETCFFETSNGNGG